MHLHTVHSWKSQLLRAESKKKKKNVKEKHRRHFHCNPNGHIGKNVSMTLSNRESQIRLIRQKTKE